MLLVWSGQLTRQLENKGEVLQYEGYLELQDYYWNDDLGIFCMKKILACIFWVNWFDQGFFLFFSICLRKKCIQSFHAADSNSLFYVNNYSSLIIFKINYSYLSIVYFLVLISFFAARRTPWQISPTQWILWIFLSSWCLMVTPIKHNRGETASRLRVYSVVLGGDKMNSCHRWFEKGICCSESVRDDYSRLT